MKAAEETRASPASLRVEPDRSTIPRVFGEVAERSNARLC